MDLCSTDQMSDLSWSSMVDLADPGVKASYATEACGERDLAHGQSRFVDKFLGEVQAPGLGHRTRRRPQVLDEQTAKVA
jgi:hypothetical protein